MHSNRDANFCGGRTARARVAAQNEFRTNGGPRTLNARDKHSEISLSFRAIHILGNQKSLYKKISFRECCTPQTVRNLRF
jgi:hypothetical protein